MSVSDKLIRTPSPLTARELLVEAAGEEHATHSIAGKLAQQPEGRIAFRCGGRWPKPCGALCFVKNTPENVLALQNVVVESEAGKVAKGKR